MQLNLKIFGIELYYSKCGPQTSSFASSGCCGISGPTLDLLNQNLQFDKISRWLTNTLKFRKP